MITKQDIHDEARLRILDVVSGHRGGDLTLKTLQIVIRHIVSPQQATRQTLHSVLQLIACCNRLEKSLPDDYRHDRHWQRGPAPVFVDMTPPSSALEERLARLEAELARQPKHVVIEHTPSSVALVPMATADSADRSIDVASGASGANGAIGGDDDRDQAELEAVAEIAATADMMRARLAPRAANALVAEAAERAAGLRLLQTAAEIETEKRRVLAYLTSRAA